MALIEDIFSIIGYSIGLSIRYGKIFLLLVAAVSIFVLVLTDKERMYNDYQNEIQLLRSYNEKMRNENIVITNEYNEKISEIYYTYNSMVEEINFLREENNSLKIEKVNIESKVDKKDQLIKKVSTIEPNYPIKNVVQAVDAAIETENPELVMAIAIKESGLNPKLVGDGGNSLGLGQIQPKYWTKFLEEKTGEKITRDSYFDPRLSLKFTSEIIHHLLEMNDGDEQVALRIYNAGNNWRGSKAGSYSNDVLKILSEIE